MEVLPGAAGLQRRWGHSATTFWEREWDSHREERAKQQLRRRAVLALVVVSEPLREVFLDTCWSAWVELAETTRRTRELPRPQRVFESLRSVLDERGTSSFSDEQLEAIVQKVAPSLCPNTVTLLLRQVPHNGAGRVTLNTFLDLIYESLPATKASDDGVTCEDHLDGEPARWQRDWEVHCEVRRRAQLRRGAIMALALLAEPNTLGWSEVYLDTAWSAWSEFITDVRRLRTLPVAQRQFELQAAAHATRPQLETLQ